MWAQLFRPYLFTIGVWEVIILSLTWSSLMCEMRQSPTETFQKSHFLLFCWLPTYEISSFLVATVWNCDSEALSGSAWGAPFAKSISMWSGVLLIYFNQNRVLQQIECGSHWENLAASCEAGPKMFCKNAKTVSLSHHFFHECYLC